MRKCVTIYCTRLDLSNEKIISSFLEMLCFNTELETIDEPSRENP